jgi:hypothetical protein
MKFNLKAGFLMGLISSGTFVGCQPKTPAEKVKDKVEDIQHETGQSMERAGERIKKSGE